MREILQFIKEWLGLMAPIGVGLGAFYKYWLKKRLEELKELYSKVKVIADEFKPNGGSTLRDAINRIERKVTLQDQKITAIVKTLPNGMWTAGADGKLIEINKNLCRISGRAESELVGDNWIQWVVEREMVFDEWYSSVENDINFDCEYTFILPSKKKQRVHSFAQRLKNESGELIGFLGATEILGEPF